MDRLPASGSIAASGDIHATNVITGIQHNFTVIFQQPFQPPANLVQLRLDYLTYLCNSYRYLDMEGIRQVQQVTHQLALTAVYVPLKAYAGHTVAEGRVAGRLWPVQEWTMLRRAWQAGASVPYPVEQTDHGLLMEFIGDDSQAAPKLGQARLSATELTSAWEQLLASMRALTAAGLVHADLSAYNLLWWEARLVVIDLPQAVEFTTNTDAYDLLHRDIANVGQWFNRHGAGVDVEAVYADLLALAW